MKMSKIISAALICLSVAPASAMGKVRQPFKLITAYTRAIPESEQTNPSMSGHFFVIRWETKSLPSSFFWRGTGGWLTCNIQKAHRHQANGKTTYSFEPMDITTITSGDTLMLTPIVGGRFAIPKEIPATAKNTLYYRIGEATKWSAFPVKKITKQ